MTRTGRTGDWSRRRFLRVAGGGAATLGGASLVGFPQQMLVARAETQEIIFAAADWWINKQTSLERFAALYAQQFPERRIRLLRFSLETPRALLENQQGRSSIDSYGGAGSPAGNLPLIQAGVFVPLDDVMPPDIKNDIQKSVLAGAVLQGKLYMFPLQAAGTSVGYRKSMLKQAGVGAPPDYLDDYIAMLEAIRKSAKAPDGSPVFPLTWDPLRPWRLVSSVGLSMLGMEGYWSADPEAVVNWDNPGMVDVLEFLKRLVPYSPPEIFSPGDVYADVMGAGRAAIMWSAEGRPVEYAQRTFGLDDLGLAVPPRPRRPIQGDGSVRGVSGAEGVYFFRHSPRWRMALDFVVWLYRKGSFQESLATEGGWTPVSIAADTSKQLPAWVKSTQECISRERPFPSTPYLRAWIASWPPVLVSYLQGHIGTAKEALARGKDELATAVRVQKGR